MIPFFLQQTVALESRFDKLHGDELDLTLPGFCMANRSKNKNKRALVPSLFAVSNR